MPIDNVQVKIDPNPLIKPNHGEDRSHFAAANQLRILNREGAFKRK